ncbi:peptidoglycan-binding domain-containing protein [Olleya sp. YS]|uniref:peptidoglycan-binding domain-containing protein n=1 Tax=Olleya sp. YS TaxID=3028318 RepID=UPI00243458D3|nr:peptidoglycan-binding domain-containing protein [Olleya sp. YS]WGD35903.1 peptidoglycan-binding domain-containing protein [Olleya sp. YS]
MKKILIAILVVIVLIFAYNQYKEYQRFHPKHANYNTSKPLDLNHHNQEVVYNYNEAVEQLNSYVTMQWSANGIDVRSPESDDAETTLAVNTYAKKLAKVKFYEAKLEQSKQLKDKGFSNESIQLFEETGMSQEAYQKHIEDKTFKNRLLLALPKGNLRSGEKSAFIYEIQKLLVKKGYEIPVDGVYKSITQNAILDFETKNNLFADGNIDQLTLETLMD